MPDISVVIPAYNAAKFLASAIESVLAQSQPAAEILIVDDGSIDATRDVATRYAPAVTLLTQANRGTAAARNTGIAASSGTYVALLDADDLMFPPRLELQLAALEAAPQIDLAFCQQAIFRDGELPDAQQQTSPTQTRLGVLPGTMFARRAAFENYGPFPEAFRIGEFIIWMQQARARGCLFTSVEQPLIHRRIHAGSASQTLRGDYSKIVHMLRGTGGGTQRRAA